MPTQSAIVPGQMLFPPYRGTFGQARTPALNGISLPPAAMPPHHNGRPLKAWRYVGVFGPGIMMCLTQVRIGRGRQTFWAVWDRQEGRLYERTRLGSREVRLWTGGARLADRSVRVDLELDETAGVETVCQHGRSYAWTRKQGGIAARGTIVLEGVARNIDARAVVDDTAAYYARHTRWRWCAGVGRSSTGQALAWNLVEGVNDPPASSERTVWVEGRPVEAAPCSFSDDLRRVDDLYFAPEASLERRQNLLLVRSAYRQPFGTFSGVLPGGITLAEGYGVMEEHEAAW